MYCMHYVDDLNLKISYKNQQIIMKMKEGNFCLWFANIYKLAGGSLRSPPTRNVKNNIYIIILSVCLCVPTSGSLALLGSLSASKQSFLGGLYSKRNTFSSAAGAPGAPGARSGFFLMNRFFFAKTFYLF